MLKFKPEYDYIIWNKEFLEYNLDDEFFNL
jgi:hypothetical protein